MADFLSSQKLLAALLLQKKLIIKKLAANILMRISIVKIVCECFLPCQESRSERNICCIRLAQLSEGGGVESGVGLEELQKVLYIPSFSFLALTVTLMLTYLLYCAHIIIIWQTLNCITCSYVKI